MMTDSRQNETGGGHGAERSRTPRGRHGRRSAGILLFRQTPAGRQFLIVHPGGPFWARKDAGAWSIPKGLVDPDEDELGAARREFSEETGHRVPDGPVHALGEVRQAGGKTVVAFAVEGDLDVADIVSNTFEMRWPPRSQRMQSFPEIDRACWADAETAAAKLNPALVELLTRLEEKVS